MLRHCGDKVKVTPSIVPRNGSNEKEKIRFFGKIHRIAIFARDSQPPAGPSRTGRRLRRRYADWWRDSAKQACSASCRLRRHHCPAVSGLPDLRAIPNHGTNWCFSFASFAKTFASFAVKTGLTAKDARNAKGRPHAVFGIKTSFCQKHYAKR